MTSMSVFSTPWLSVKVRRLTLPSMRTRVPFLGSTPARNLASVLNAEQENHWVSVSPLGIGELTARVKATMGRSEEPRTCASLPSLPMNITLFMWTPCRCVHC
jgi:hypothetical protein